MNLKIDPDRMKWLEENFPANGDCSASNRKSAGNQQGEYWWDAEGVGGTGGISGVGVGSDKGAGVARDIGGNVGGAGIGTDGRGGAGTAGSTSGSNCKRGRILISSPGRTEVGGNHTDHQNGNVLAAAINLDVLCLACKADDNIIEVNTKEFGSQKVDVSDLTKNANDTQTQALIRGVIAYFVKNGYKVGGVKASLTSDVLVGSGLSSSAAFENAIGQALNYLYNDGTVPLTSLALAGKYAENNYIDKLSGLMDQTASAFGGFVQIDFFDPKNPKIQNIKIDLQDFGLHLCIVDTKGSHADLAEAYSSIPVEMGKVAEVFGKSVLSQVSEAEFMDNIEKARKFAGDRAVLRAIHFFTDTRRAVLEAKALQERNIREFLQLVRESGQSSAIYLQNVWNTVLDQGVPLGLALSSEVLKREGAWRVHGGGFAGTIQAFVPEKLLDKYTKTLDNVFGKGSCKVLNVREAGTVLVR